MPPIRIALAQINATVGDFDVNVAMILDYVDRARQSQADLIAFPELALCGYPPEDLLLKPHFLRDNRKALQKLARAARDIAIVVGFADQNREGTYNAAAVLADKRIVGTYHKMQLPNYGVFDEKRYFVSGSRAAILVVRAVPIALTICEDIWCQPGPAEIACRAGAQAVLNISGSPYHTGKLKERTALVRSLARRCKAAVCYANLVGGQDELVFDGGSMVVNSRGRTVAQAKQFEEELLIAGLDLSKRSIRRSSGIDVISIGSKAAKAICKPTKVSKHTVAESLSRCEEIYTALATGTRDYVRKNGFQKVVIGLSGGIDSALTAAIAVDALGKDNVVGVTMPSRYSSKETRSDARRLAANLDITLLTLPIKDVLDSYVATLAECFAGTKSDVTEENLQARIRGNLLMALSNKFGWLVLTTGNKSETSVGYCTLYGDMAGGFGVIKDVPKTWVFELSAYRNSLGKKPVIPPAIISRPPSAELRPNQRDQDSLPPYDILDQIVDSYVERDLSAAQVARQGIDAKTVAKVIRLIDRSEYKRRQAAPGVKITPRAFGRDRRMPISNRYENRT